MINSTQIARLAGVSRSTVSKVINDYPDIPEETKMKVRSVIKEHRYIPNASAQVLKGKAQSVVALYVYASAVDAGTDSLCRLSSPYVMGVISNFIMAANQRGHRMIIELLRHGEDEQKVFQRISGHFESRSIAAAAFLGLPTTAGFIDQLVSEDLPVAVIDRPVDSSKKAVNIFTDDQQGAYKATSQLVNEGFRHIVFVNGEQEKHSASARAKGYSLAMEQHALKPELLDGDYSEQSGARAADLIVTMKPRPEAVVCASDTIAYGLIQRLHETNKDYLDQLGLIGFDDTYFNDFQHPPLSSVKVDFAAMAHSTITALLEPENYQPNPVPVELVVRASCKLRCR